jgi:hypothetical protein
MSIDNFPASLQPIVQTGFLNREFKSGLRSKEGYRQIADKISFPCKIGQTITDTRTGLKAPVETYIDPSTNTGLDNGMTSSEFAVEQYTMTIAQAQDTIDLNIVTSGVAIASVFMENARVTGVQASQSLDRFARNALYFGAGIIGVNDVGGYLGGNTRVATALSADSTTLHVDDIRGFVNIVGPMGTVVPVSNANPAIVTINGVASSLVGVTPDSAGSNVSTAPKGLSGTLNFSANVLETNGALNASVVIATAPVVLRPNRKATTAALVAGDTLTMKAILAAKAQLANNAVPTIDGLYNCYLDESMLLGLFDDPQFQVLYRGGYDSKEFKSGEVFKLLGVRFITTTEAPQQMLNGLDIHRAIVVGKGALVENDFEGMDANIPDANRSMIETIDGVKMVTREPLDRLGQIIAQSWYWIGGFGLPTDVTANSLIIPTASNSALKRGVVIESTSY